MTKWGSKSTWNSGTYSWKPLTSTGIREEQLVVGDDAPQQMRDSGIARPSFSGSVRCFFFQVVICFSLKNLESFFENFRLTFWAVHSKTAAGVMSTISRWLLGFVTRSWQQQAMESYLVD
jgi:hypothetical protein